MGIVVKELEKWHRGGSRAVLRGLSMSVAPGEVAAVMGGSGAGKTTLLRCLVGLDPFEGGELEVAGRSVPGTEGGYSREHQEARRALAGVVGMVFQSLELFPHLSVLENCVLAPMQVRGVARSSAEAEARRWLGELDVGDKAAAYPMALSGGQRQRVAIARALCMQPRVLLYDEPTSALDAHLKMEVVRMVEKLQATGITQLMVVHDAHVARHADRLFILDDGMVVEEGAPTAVLDAPRHAATLRLLQRAP